MKHRSEVQKQFGANAQRYVTSQVHAQGQSLTRMVVLAAPQPHWVALDVACGGGHAALAIARHVHQVIALDVTFPMLQAARAFAAEQEMHNLVWVQGDAEELPFVEASFDLITCRVAMHHFPNPQKAIASWARTLKPGGKLVLIDNIGPEDEQANLYVNTFETLRDPSHVQLYPPTELVRFLEQADLSVLHTEVLRKPMGFEAWMDRMQVAPEARKQLTAMLWESKDHARQFLNPQGHGEDATFDLWEGIFLAAKASPQSL